MIGWGFVVSFVVNSYVEPSAPPAYYQNEKTIATTAPAYAFTPVPVQAVQQQPAGAGNTTVIIRDSGPSYGG